MSQGLTTTVKSIGKFFVNWSIRMTKYFKHRIMTKRKNILIFAEATNPLYTHMHNALNKHWEITRIFVTPPAIQDQSEIKEESSSTEIEEVKEPTKPTFYHEYYLNKNYQQLENRFEGKQFDSIVVLPLEQSQKNSFNFDDQRIITDYLQQYQMQLMRNVFSYRLANKYLTTTGVLILSGSERDFLKAYDEQITKEVKHFQEGKWYPSIQLIDAQSNYLGSTVGERDYTDLNSWSLVAMSREWIKQNPAFISKQYCSWASGADLPIPGSFAVFKRKTAQYKQHYLEYL